MYLIDARAPVTFRTWIHVFEFSAIRSFCFMNARINGKTRKDYIWQYLCLAWWKSN